MHAVLLPATRLFFRNSSTTKTRSSPNHAMVYTENGTYTAVRRRAPYPKLWPSQIGGFFLPHPVFWLASGWRWWPKTVLAETCSHVMYYWQYSYVMTVMSMHNCFLNFSSSCKLQFHIHFYQSIRQEFWFICFPKECIKKYIRKWISFPQHCYLMTVKQVVHDEVLGPSMQDHNLSKIKKKSY